ncbi:MAG TPA: rod shape-determining protein [Clostridiales bacterium]|nr:rod shape-determining protein [Clostridiales bacterium]
MLGFRDIGIDLGTASILVYMKGKGIVLREPSVISIDKDSGQVLAVGSEAQRMLGRTPGNIVAMRPLEQGVISDYHVTKKMLKYFLNRVAGRQLAGKPRVVICVPSSVTEVEKRAVLDAASEAGAGRTYLIEEPIAAAIGAGLDIARPCGHMVVDIGGGTSDIAVISLGGSVLSESIKVAGNDFDKAIEKYMRKKYNLLIGDGTAERMKMEIGCAFPREEELFMDVTGRNLVSGLPRVIRVSSTEMMEALEEPVQEISECVHSILEKTPPELAADISEQGIIMTGGGALLYGFDKLLQQQTKIDVYVAEDAVSCVALGTGKALESLDVYSSSAMFEHHKGVPVSD